MPRSPAACAIERRSSNIHHTVASPRRNYKPPLSASSAEASSRMSSFRYPRSFANVGLDFCQVGSQGRVHRLLRASSYTRVSFVGGSPSGFNSESRAQSRAYVFNCFLCSSAGFPVLKSTISQSFCSLIIRSAIPTHLSSATLSSISAWLPSCKGLRTEFLDFEATFVAWSGTRIRRARICNISRIWDVRESRESRINGRRPAIRGLVSYPEITACRLFSTSLL